MNDIFCAVMPLQTLGWRWRGMRALFHLETGTVPSDTVETRSLRRPQGQGWGKEILTDPAWPPILFLLPDPWNCFLFAGWCCRWTMTSVDSRAWGNSPCSSGSSKPRSKPQSPWQAVETCGWLCCGLRWQGQTAARGWGEAAPKPISAGPRGEH